MSSLIKNYVESFGLLTEREVNTPHKPYKFIPLEFLISSVINLSNRAGIGSHVLGELIDFAM